MGKIIKVIYVLLTLIILINPLSPLIYAKQINLPQSETQIQIQNNQVPGKIIVKFKNNQEFIYEQQKEITLPLVNQKIEIQKEGFASKNSSSITQITKDNNIENIKRVYENVPTSIEKDKAYIMSVNDNEVEKTIQDLKNNPEVEYAQPNYIFQAFYSPNDPYFSSTPLNYFQWNLARINAPQVWDITKGNSSVKVAVLDSGAAIEDYTEGGIQYRKAPELANTQVAARYRHVSISCTGTTTCNCTDLATPIIDNHAVDIFGHGTHVTETIFQAMNNQTHATGIAPNASLIAIRASSEGSNPGCFSDTDILAGLEFAKQNGANVVNMSLGGSGFDNAQNNKIQELINAGITIVAASGNGASRTSSPAIGFPAGYPNVIAVGATKWDNIRAKYSQYGTPDSGHNVTLVAPGGQVVKDDRSDFVDQNNDKLPDGIVQQTIIEGQSNSFTQIDTTPNQDWGGKFCITGSYSANINENCGLLQGTSMATPHVTATVALMKSVNPNLTPAQILQILIQTANKSIIPNYNENEYGAGLLDVYAAVVAAGGGINQTQKGWNKLTNPTFSTTNCLSNSQKIMQWISSKTNYRQNTVSNSIPNFYKCN